MNTDRKDTNRMGNEITHELITGRTGAGKTTTVRDRLDEELSDPNTVCWIVDPYMALVTHQNKAARYARTRRDIEDLLRAAAEEAVGRAEELAAAGVRKFVVGDDRHGVPLLVLTIEEAHQVLANPANQAHIRQVVRMGRQTGVKVRMVAYDAGLNSFGGDEVTRMAMTSGKVTHCGTDRAACTP